MANIKTIAAAAGVSIATVSRVLQEPEKVRPSTREKVMEAVRAAGYQPNAMASALRRKRSDSVVVVVPNIQNPFFAGVVQGIEHTAHAEGYQLLLGESGSAGARLDSYAGLLGSKVADGLILLGAQLPPSLEKMLLAGQSLPAPLVMACEYRRDHALPTVRIDNVAAARAATRHLIDLGHRRIATLTGPLDNPLGQDRLAGFQAAMREAGLEVPPYAITTGAFDLGTGYAGMLRLLEVPVRPTAVFIASDEMAIGALAAAKARGLSVPADLSVVGFDGLRFADYSDPPLTTVVQPCADLGAMAMRHMVEAIRTGDRAATDIVLPTRLLARRSSGPVPLGA